MAGSESTESIAFFDSPLSIAPTLTLFVPTSTTFSLPFRTLSETFT